MFVLIVLGGLPGIGLTTIARRIASQRAATYLLIDAIEQAIRDAGVPADEVGAAGYTVAKMRSPGPTSWRRDGRRELRQSRAG